jgi:phosphomannomutase
MKARGLLTDDTLVATVMSNLGLKRAMAEHGVRMIETGVGDRYVLEALAEHGLALGGEQSGHIIMSEHATTGDGILTGLQLAAEMVRSGKTLAELADVMTSATVDACCCARAAPNRWCASWSKLPSSPSPKRLLSASPRSFASSSPSSSI